MPEPNKDVKLDSSASSVKVDSQSTDELAKTKADNERLKGAMSSLQTERDEIREKLDRLEEIENRRELSAKEEIERRRLERGADNIDDQIEDLRRKPEAKPWFTHLEREISKATKTASNDAIIILAADFLEEMAEDLSSKEEYKDITDEKLLKLIRPYMGQFETKSSLRKTKLAFKAWQESESYKKEKAETVRKKAEESLSLENGGRLARESSAQDIFNKQGTLEPSEKALLREKLGIMQRSK